MRQKTHFTSYPSPLSVSPGVRRLVQGLACVVVLAATSLPSTPVQAQGTTPGTMTQGKKGKTKKNMTPTPPKMTEKKTTMMAAPARLVVVFPPETKGGVSDQIADVITDVVQSRLNLSGKYRTVYFLGSSPIIRRGLTEGTLTKEDVDKPTATDGRMKKLTELLGHEMAIAVSIIDYQYDKATNKVSLVMSAKILDYTGPAPRGTGNNGDSPDKPSAKATEYDLAAALARDLTEKMMNDLLAPPKKAMTESTEKK